MKKQLSVLLIIGFVFYIIGCEEMPQEATNEESSDIEALEKGGDWGYHRGSEAIHLIPKFYKQAWETNDIELFGDLWAEDGIQMPPDAPHVVGRENIVAGAAPLMENFDVVIDITVIEAKAVSKRWGFMWGVYTMVATPKVAGEGFSVDGKFSTVVKKRHYRDPLRKKLGPWEVYIDCFNSNVP
jgi:uncharacterized protein (TIGR02246 family)